jgi:ABC-type branched-subunit amino acid transport system ATPase component
MRCGAPAPPTATNCAPRWPTDELDFELYPGEILGVIGPNGAGKITTFNLIAGALAADQGTIHLAGQRLSGLAPHAVAAQGVMRTFQHNQVFAGMSLLDNVLVGAHCRRAGSLWSLLRGSGATRRTEQTLRRHARELIEFVGLSASLDADVATLSFGHGRLLEVARALAGEPKVILLDEPAAGLAPDEIARLAQIITAISARGVAVLLIEHDMHFLLPLAQRVVVLNFGRKIADATPDAIRGDPAVVAAYLGKTHGTVTDGMTIVPLGYRAQEIRDLSGAHGGSPYGASVIARGEGSRPTPQEQAAARVQGQALGAIARALTNH